MVLLLADAAVFLALPAISFAYNSVLPAKTQICLLKYFFSFPFPSPNPGPFFFSCYGRRLRVNFVAHFFLKETRNQKVTYIWE